MKLIDLNINKILLLGNFKFSDPYNNIDFLNQQTLLSTDLNRQLFLLKTATAKVEKFHSFFHFEQSYFHLQLALHFIKNKNIDKANEQLKLAIVQDPLNKQAKQLLENSNDLKIYNRIYNNFLDYLFFATEEPGKHQKAEGYWQDYLEYQQNPKANLLKKIIEKIRGHHLNYHQEAAKLYLNRAMIFYYLEHIDLAKNDLVKANNLDNKLNEKEYYKLIKALLNFHPEDQAQQLPD